MYSFLKLIAMKSGFIGSFRCRIISKWKENRRIYFVCRRRQKRMTFWECKCNTRCPIVILAGVSYTFFVFVSDFHKFQLFGILIQFFSYQKTVIHTNVTWKRCFEAMCLRWSMRYEIHIHKSEVLLFFLTWLALVWHMQNSCHPIWPNGPSMWYKKRFQCDSKHFTFCTNHFTSMPY